MFDFLIMSLDKEFFFKSWFLLHHPKIPRNPILISYTSDSALAKARCDLPLTKQPSAALHTKPDVPVSLPPSTDSLA